MDILQNPKWRFVVDCAEIISASAVSVAGITAIVHFIAKGGHSALLYIAISVVFALGAWTMFKALTASVNETKKKYNRAQLEASVKAETEKLTPLNPNRVVPSKSFVDKTIKALDKDSQEWSPDAKRESINLYLNVGEKVTFSFQSIYVSEWKDLVRTAYVRSNFAPSEDFEEKVVGFSSNSKTFNKQFPNWRKAVIACIESLHEALPEEYKISIFEGEPLRISFHYTHNKIERHTQFTFDGNDLLNVRSNKKLKL